MYVQGPRPVVRILPFLTYPLHQCCAPHPSMYMPIPNPNILVQWRSGQRTKREWERTLYLLQTAIISGSLHNSPSMPLHNYYYFFHGRSVAAPLLFYLSAPPPNVRVLNNSKTNENVKYVLFFILLINQNLKFSF